MLSYRHRGGFSRNILLCFGREYHFFDEKDNSYDLTMDPITSRKLLGDNDFDKDTIYTIIYETKSETIVGINVHNTN